MKIKKNFELLRALKLLKKNIYVFDWFFLVCWHDFIFIRDFISRVLLGILRKSYGSGSAYAAAILLLFLLLLLLFLRFVLADRKTGGFVLLLLLTVGAAADGTFPSTTNAHGMLLLVLLLVERTMFGDRDDQKMELCSRLLSVDCCPIRLNDDIEST